jgi:hypothetical protein
VADRRASRCDRHRSGWPRRRPVCPDLEEKIARDHPELVDHLEAVMETVAKPDHVEPDALPARRRF